MNSLFAAVVVAAWVAALAALQAFYSRPYVLFTIAGRVLRPALVSFTPVAAVSVAGFAVAVFVLAGGSVVAAGWAVFTSGLVACAVTDALERVIPSRLVTVWGVFGMAAGVFATGKDPTFAWWWAVVAGVCVLVALLFAAVAFAGRGGAGDYRLLFAAAAFGWLLGPGVVVWLAGTFTLTLIVAVVQRARTGVVSAPLACGAAIAATATCLVAS